MARYYLMSDACVNPTIISDAEFTYLHGRHTETGANNCGITHIDDPTTEAGAAFNLDSLDTSLVSTIVGGALLLFAVGMGIGFLISVIRRTRL